MRDLFEQMGVAHDMERQQVQSLLIEPLQAMVDDPKGLASGSRLFSPLLASYLYTLSLTRRSTGRLGLGPPAWAIAGRPTTLRTRPVARTWQQARKQLAPGVDQAGA